MPITHSPRLLRGNGLSRFGGQRLRGLATALEKSARNPGQISSPGGSFRAMIDRAVEGSLHLEKSLFGLADTAVKHRREHKS